jgi:hypothetical protein
MDRHGPFHAGEVRALARALSQRSHDPEQRADTVRHRGGRDERTR